MRLSRIVFSKLSFFVVISETIFGNVLQLTLLSYQSILLPIYVQAQGIYETKSESVDLI